MRNRNEAKTTQITFKSAKWQTKNGEKAQMQLSDCSTDRVMCIEESAQPSRIHI